MFHIAKNYTGMSKQLKKPIEFKQYYLEPMQHFDNEYQLEVLQKILLKKMSIAEMQEDAKQVIKVENLWGLPPNALESLAKH